MKVQWLQTNLDLKVSSGIYKKETKKGTSRVGKTLHKKVMFRVIVNPEEKVYFLPRLYSDLKSSILTRSLMMCI